MNSLRSLLQGPLRFSGVDERPTYTGVTRMADAVEASRLMVPPFTLIMHCCPPPLQSNSSSEPGRTPKLAILAQVCRSPLTEHTRMRRLQQVSVRGMLAWLVARPHFHFRHRQRCCSSLSNTLEESSAGLSVMVSVQGNEKGTVMRAAFLAWILFSEKSKRASADCLS